MGSVPTLLGHFDHLTMVLTTSRKNTHHKENMVFIGKWSQRTCTGHVIGKWTVNATHNRLGRYFKPPCSISMRQGFRQCIYYLYLPFVTGEGAQSRVFFSGNTLPPVKPAQNNLNYSICTTTTASLDSFMQHLLCPPSLGGEQMVGKGYHCFSSRRAALRLGNQQLPSYPR
jgi:hypothetical protein